MKKNKKTKVNEIELQFVDFLQETSSEPEQPQEFTGTIPMGTKIILLDDKE